MKRIAIIGGGLMGAGIAQLFASHGFSVAVVEPNERARSSFVQRVVAIGRSLSQQPDYAERVECFPEIRNAVETADFVIEAVSEQVELKQSIFEEVVRVAAPAAILSTNSSVIPVGTVAARLEHRDAERVVGTHFWNPPYLIPLVEVIQGPRSGAVAIGAAMSLLREVGKKPVHLRRDVVAANRLQHALWREAMALVEEGVCDAAGVDDLVKSSFGLRLSVLGPLENADLVGLDLTHSIHEVVLPTLSGSTRPLAVLTRLREAGQLGMKSGRGFYQWSESSAQSVKDRLTEHLRAALTNNLARAIPPRS
jgi:3-hydroxybutyryl-CoA dehydrogenase